jgi:hypothetical protein
MRQWQIDLANKENIHHAERISKLEDGSRNAPESPFSRHDLQAEHWRDGAENFKQMLRRFAINDPGIKWNDWDKHEVAKDVLEPVIFGGEPQYGRADAWAFPENFIVEFIRWLKVVRRQKGGVGGIMPLTHAEIPMAVKKKNQTRAGKSGVS